MIDLADAEAAHLGNVASTCIRRGAIPPVSLRPLWFTNRGKCIGLRIIGHDEDEFDLNGNHTGPDYLDPLRPIVQHLKAYAGEVVETEGVGWLLYEWEHTRDIFYVLYPDEEGKDEWLTLESASREAGKTTRTIRRWMEVGSVRHIGVGADLLIYRKDLEMMMQIVKDNLKRGGRPASVD